MRFYNQFQGAQNSSKCGLDAICSISKASLSLPKLPIEVVRAVSWVVFKTDARRSSKPVSTVATRANERS